MTYKFNAPWHPLKKVCLGRSYPEAFYKDIRNGKIRNVLQQLAYETEEDYKNIQNVLESLGVTVVRPIIPDSNIMDYVNQKGQLNYKTTKSFTLIPKPPMQPRDSQLIVGDKLLATNSEITMYKSVLEHNQINHVPKRLQFDAPLVTVIGNSLIVDKRDHPWLGNYMSEYFTDRKIIAVDIGGHNDAVFAPILPGVIISTHYKKCYKESFPKWNVFHIKKQSWNALPKWRKLKHSNQDKWWMPGEENNKEFVHFVDDWISHWLGFVAETVFDVNVLVVNPKIVLVNNYNAEVFAFFKKHHIEPIITSFRHRFFWDGGIHCITSDLYREGEPEDYI